MITKLQIGCGGNPREGWLNTDLEPVSEDVAQLDVTKPFPFPSNDFDFIFSEHLIEHVTYPEGVAMLKECYRVLRPGGTVRISTPDLEFVLSLYSPVVSQHKYIEWATQLFIKDAPYAHPTFVINNFVRNWGHTFIYDEDVLADVLCNAGFSQIVRCELCKSQHQELRDLENEKRLPAGYLAMETLTLEGTK